MDLRYYDIERETRLIVRGDFCVGATGGRPGRMPFAPTIPLKISLRREGLPWLFALILSGLTYQFRVGIDAVAPAAPTHWRPQGRSSSPTHSSRSDGGSRSRLLPRKAFCRLRRWSADSNLLLLPGSSGRIARTGPYCRSTALPQDHRLYSLPLGGLHQSRRPLSVEERDQRVRHPGGPAQSVTSMTPGDRKFPARSSLFISTNGSPPFLRRLS